MHINDFKKQNEMSQNGMKTNNFKKQIEMNQSAMKTNDFKSQSGMKIVGLSLYYCTKCGLPSPVKLPTKCPAGGFHIWAKAN